MNAPKKSVIGCYPPRSRRFVAFVFQSRNAAARMDSNASPFTPRDTYPPTPTLSQSESSFFGPQSPGTGTADFVLSLSRQQVSSRPTRVGTHAPSPLQHSHTLVWARPPRFNTRWLPPRVYPVTARPPFQHGLPACQHAPSVLAHARAHPGPTPCHNAPPCQHLICVPASTDPDPVLKRGCVSKRGGGRASTGARVWR